MHRSFQRSQRSLHSGNKGGISVREDPGGAGSS